MAELEKIAELLKVKLSSSLLLINTENNKKNIGKKRRPWLLNELNSDSNNSSIDLDNNLDNKLGNLDNRLGILDNKLDNKLADLDNNLDNKLENKLENSLGNKTKVGVLACIKKNQVFLNNNKTIIFVLSSLNKSKKKIFRYLLNSCITNGTCDTGPMQSQKIALDVNIPYKSFKTILGRLIKTNLISRNTGKTSQSGYIDIHIFKTVMELAISYYVSDDNLGNRLGNTLDNNIYSSGSNIIYKTTTTGDNQKLNPLALSTEWQDIDIEPLNKIGFTSAHLSQIAIQNKLQPQVVQDSIYAFSFDLQENDKAKKIKADPISFFMGIVRSGKPYAPPGNYESPQDKAMRLYREKMREIEKGRVEAEKEAIALAFNDWFKQLVDEEKIKFLPKNLQANARIEKNKMLEGSARNYFETEIWPDKKYEIIGDIKNTKKEG